MIYKIRGSFAHSELTLSRFTPSLRKSWPEKAISKIMNNPGGHLNKYGNYFFFISSMIMGLRPHLDYMRPSHKYN